MAQQTRTPGFRQAPSVVSAVVGQEVVLLNVETGVYYGLNDVAGAIWLLLADGASVEQLCEGVERQFLTHRSEVTAHVEELLIKFCDLNLVVPG